MRRAFSDKLEECDDKERADFIRWHIEQHNSPRTAELLQAMRQRYGIRTPFEVRRVIAEKGHCCPHREEYNRNFLIRGEEPPEPFADGDFVCGCLNVAEVDFIDGMAEVVVANLWEWERIGPRLVREELVTTLTIVRAMPDERLPGGHFWISRPLDRNLSSVPNHIFRHLPRMVSLTTDVPTEVGYRTLEQAMGELSAAALNWAKTPELRSQE